jgi:hypothetical protein
LCDNLPKVLHDGSLHNCSITINIGPLRAIHTCAINALILHRAVVPTLPHYLWVIPSDRMFPWPVLNTLLQQHALLSQQTIVAMARASSSTSVTHILENVHCLGPSYAKTSTPLHLQTKHSPSPSIMWQQALDCKHTAAITQALATIKPLPWHSLSSGVSLHFLVASSTRGTCPCGRRPSSRASDTPCCSTSQRGRSHRNALLLVPHTKHRELGPLGHAHLVLSLFHTQTPLARASGPADSATSLK